MINAYGGRRSLLRAQSRANTQYEGFNYAEPNAADTTGKSQQESWEECEGRIEGREIGEA